MSKSILLVVDSMFPLGSGHQVSLLARGLADRAMDVHVAITHDSPSAPFPVPKFCHIHHLELGKHDWLGWRELRKLIKAIRPDIVHDWGQLPLVYAAANDLTPLISTVDRAPHLLGKPGLGHIAKQGWDWLHRRTRPVHFVATHQCLATKLNDNGIDESELAIITPAVQPPKIDLQAAKADLRKQFDLPAESLVATAYAPFFPSTRLKDLIWATDLLVCIRKDFHFVLMGTGQQEIRLKRFLRTTEAPQHVHFAELPADPMSHIAGADAFWQSNLLYPHPPGLLQAMAMETPVISVLGEETSDAITHQTTGLGVNLGARDEFARWTKYLIEIPASGKKLAAQAKSHVAQQFPLQKMIDEYVQFYSAMGKN